MSCKRFIITIIETVELNDIFIAVETQRDESKKEGLQGLVKLEDTQNERDGFRNSVVALQTSMRRVESDRAELMKCLEEARKRIGGTPSSHSH